MPELLFMTAFFAGLLGSTHCLGMCGGIAAALGGAARPAAARAWAPLLYNLGRIASYGIAGAVAGAVGVAASGLLPGVHAGEYLRLATAAAVGLIGLNMAAGGAARARWLGAPERWGGALWRRFSPPLQRRLPRGPLLRPLGIGLLWGWLPCGLVYSALLAAAASGSAARGSATMCAFGLGTLPAMAGISYLGSRLPSPRGVGARLLGAAIIACALWIAALPLESLMGLGDHARHHHALADTRDAPASGAPRAGR